MYSYIFKTFRFLSFTIIVFCFFYSVFSVASVSILMPFVNFIFTDYRLSANTFLFSFSESDKSVLLAALCLITWFIFLLKNLSFIAAQLQTSRMKNELLQRLREDYMQRVFGQDMPYFSKIPTGYITTRVFDVTRQLSEKLSVGFHDVARNVPLIILYSAVLIFISWKLMALSLVLIPLISLAGNRFHKILQKSIADEQHALSSLIHHVQQKLYGIKLIKLFNSEQFELGKFHDQSSELKRVFQFRDRVESIGVSVVEMIGVSAGVLLLYVIGMETLGGQFQYGPGGFVLFIAAVFSLIDPVKNLIRSVHSFRESDVLLAMLRQLKVKVTGEHEYSQSPRLFEKQIVFENVSFQFENRSDPVFENLNMTINKGEKIILAGKSGIGKSTLVDLLLGLYQPSAGVVSLDKIPLININKTCLSRIFGVVTQEAFLFHDTIRNNVVYDMYEITDDQIMDALHKVLLSEWYIQQPRGLDTVIGDRGQTMSGGEKQRLILARLILRNPDILIFDEATSSLDIPAEKALFETILRLFSDKTMIFISHRHTLYPFGGRIVEIRHRGIVEHNVSSTFA
ncbi:ABC transporter ATP-binding protein [bacterium]|nr:ABC transporter ATP-binding protein [bacterium]